MSHVKGVDNKVTAEGEELADCERCVCCGERVVDIGRHFLWGHNGKVRWWFKRRMDKGLEEGEVWGNELEMVYGLWILGEGTIGECVKKVREKKENKC